MAAKSIFYLHKTLEQPKTRCVFLQHRPTEQLRNISTANENKQDASVTDGVNRLTDQEIVLRVVQTTIH